MANASLDIKDPKADLNKNGRGLDLGKNNSAGSNTISRVSKTIKTVSVDIQAPKVLPQHQNLDKPFGTTTRRPDHFENNPRYAALANEYNKKEPQARQIKEQAVAPTGSNEEAGPEEGDEDEDEGDDDSGMGEDRDEDQGPEQGGPRQQNRQQQQSQPQRPQRQSIPAAQASGPQGGLKARQAGQALKSIVGRGLQSGDVKAGAGAWLINSLWASFLDPFPGWLWAIPLLDLYILIGYFKRDNPFFQQLAKWKKVLVILANLLIAAALVVFFIAVLDRVCSGLNGIAVRTVTNTVGPYPFCKSIPFHF